MSGSHYLELSGRPLPVCLVPASNEKGVISSSLSVVAFVDASRFTSVAKKKPDSFIHSGKSFSDQMEFIYFLS